MEKVFIILFNLIRHLSSFKAAQFYSKRNFFVIFMAISSNIVDDDIIVQ